MLNALYLLGILREIIQDDQMCRAEHAYGRSKKYVVLVAWNRIGNLQFLDAGGRLMLQQI
jgi:hypothetical protein